MLATAIIVFREVLEMAVVIGVVMAAAEGAPGRNRWVAYGLLGGFAGAALVAAFAGTISDAAEGMGQEYFNTAILAFAAGLIGWTVVWMRQHGREMAAKLKETGRSVASGESPLYMLSVVVGLAVLREGSEAVLFVYGIALSQPESALDIALGVIVGLAGGGLVGALLYLGLLKISARHLFSVTSLLLTLLASGMAAQAAGYLVAAGTLPALIDPLWDSSWLMAQDGVAGRVLSVLIGYQERPSAMQALFYVGTLIVILAASRQASKPTWKPAS
ncbi:MAG TPA: FTR1 family protein [Candidatus Sulfotelmatobacter sp.]|jgi:high-affinity iron transporter|nr:FTR1 family protein [Candidatus Sulfotelmatobacter sp.]